MTGQVLSVAPEAGAPLALMDVGAIIDAVLRRIEQSFVAAGDDLAASVEILRQLSALFDRLGVTFGPETGARLSHLAVRTRAHGDEISGGFDRFLAAGEAVRLALRGVRVEVGALDRVVRTIANVSINARIQGNGLVPPRPQVGAFIERLGVMTAEAEGIIGELRAAMAGIGDEMAAMELVTQELREALSQQVLPALGRFDRLAKGVLDRQGALAATNAALARQMAEVNAEASRLAVGLQSGDATRQRLERVRATVAAAEGSACPDRVLELAAALSAAAVAAAEAEIDATVTAADTLCRTASTAVTQARAFYTGRTGATEVSAEAGRFAESIGQVRERLGAMRARATALRGRLGMILQHEAALRRIGHRVRLSGLNAVLICAKLGEEGRALRELAQWLRTLTDESDEIVLRLQHALGRTADLAEHLSGESISALEATLDAFFEEAGALGAMIGGIGQDRRDAAALFDAVGQGLPLRLGHAAQALTRFRLLLREMTVFEAAVAARRAGLVAAPLDGAGRAVLDGLRRRYTMQAERDVHDRVVGDAGAGGEGAPSVAAAGDDLDDVLF